MYFGQNKSLDLFCSGLEDEERRGNRKKEKMRRSKRMGMGGKLQVERKEKEDG